MFRAAPCIGTFDVNGTVEAGGLRLSCFIDMVVKLANGLRRREMWIRNANARELEDALEQLVIY
jgi:hypothetical protein